MAPYRVLVKQNLIGCIYNTFILTLRGIGIMEYYEKLKAIREGQDMTQQEVAEALRTTRQQISKYENGTQLMTIGRLRELCRLYKVSSDYILGLPRGLDWPRE